MKLRIVALGHRMPGWVDAGYADYAQRLPRDYGLDLVALKPAARTLPAARVLADERRRIEAACANYRVIALDERGAAWTTRTLAQRISGWRDERTDVAFVIGSADGLDPGFKARAAERVQLSAMTLPHGLVRVLLAEQLYRAASLLAGHPYHRE
jgi:23S rRNA (pseudouridine1915-N3)-methyltransferase